MRAESKIRNEKGFAIILTIGFLALSSMMAALFVTSSITNKKTAENYSAQTASRLSAHAGIQRAIAALSLYSGDLSNDLITGHVYSKNQESISNDAKREFLSGDSGLLKTVIDNMSYYSLAENYNVSDYPTWQYFPFDHGTDTPIIGRFAYVVLSNFGKLDPSACIDSGENANSNSMDAISEDAPASEATMIDPSGNVVIGRPGRNVSELFLESLPDSWFTEEYAQKISSKDASPEGHLKLDAGTWTARWSDIYKLLDKLNVADDHKDSFRQFFSFDNSPEAEAFWIDDDGNNVKDNNEIYHRFNLTRADWNSLTIASILSPPNPYSSSQGGGIPWLNNWADAGDYPDSVTAKNQIAANLIDYNDSNTTATTDNPNNPTYVGLEKCPYINELLFEIEGEVLSPGGYTLFSASSMSIVASNVTLSNGHTNGILQIWGTITASDTFSYVGTAQVGGGASVTTEQADSQTTPSLPQALSAYQSAAAYYDNVNIKLKEAAGNQIEVVKASNGNNEAYVNNGSIIYVYGNSKSIEIDEDNFSRTVTLICEDEDIIISGDNITITPAVQNTMMYAGDTVNVTGNYFTGSGIIKSVGSMTISGTNATVSNASVWSNGSLAVYSTNGAITGEGEGSGYICNVYIKDIQLELVDMYNTPSMNCTAEVTASGSYNWLLDGTDSDVNFVKTFTLGIISGSDTYSYNATYDLADSDISPADTKSGGADLATSIEDFQITDLKVKLIDSSNNLLDYAFIEPSTTYIDVSGGITMSGDLNINPGSMSSSHPFIMQTVGNGELNRDDIASWNVTNTYNGTATEIKIKPKSPGQGGTSITIDGSEVNLETNTYYTLSGNMTVNVYNTHSNAGKSYGQATGKWWIDISGSNIAMDPGFGGSTVGGDGSPPTVSSDGTTNSLFIDYEIADPRQNLNFTDWGGITRFDTVDTGTIGSTNTKFMANPGGNADLEPYATEPWNISTAYIRNESMLSPWELGFLHRGMAWQTLNLKKYNSDSNIGEGGGGVYSDGDANVLNQIKMTSDTETYGKININTNLEEVLTVLFQKIRVGSDVGSSDGPGSITGANEVGAAAAGAFAADVLSNNSTSGGSVFYSRGEMLRSANGLINTLCYDNAVDLDRDTDATQEEIIGKFINLTQASGASNVFHIIVVVQTIKDTGSTVGNGITISKDTNHDGDISDENETVLNCKIGTYDPYADKILATQKAFVTVVRDPIDYTLRIKRFEYLDE